MPADNITPEFKATLRRLKLSPILATLPERLTLARQKMAHLDLLELVLSEEETGCRRSCAPVPPSSILR